jgi:molecular chaperone HtpG
MSKENHVFQAEVQQLLQLMIHSLYSNREIFLRELISNAADACDKLRFEALANPGLYENQQRLAIRITPNPERRTVTIADSGIGMNREEIIANLGTIAKSGTKEFLQKLSSEEAKNSQLIGQFGVGFYSAFTVAERVEVFSRRAGTLPEQGVHWVSDGLGTYSVADFNKIQRGTEIVLHLKEDAAEFAEDWRLRSLIHRYSEHLPWPIEMPSLEEKEREKGEYETVNQTQALWTRPKNELSAEDYQEFYEQNFYDYQKPLTWLHQRVEGKLEYTLLLFIPSHKPVDLFHQDSKRGIKLYVQRVFISEEKELLPRFLRFVHGLIDSNDLPLNVSREMLQSNKILEQIRQSAIKRVLELLKQTKEQDNDKYQAFYQDFGVVLKEGLIEDPSQREAIADLLYFQVSKPDGSIEKMALSDYLATLPAGQEKVYYLSSENINLAKVSPHLEAFRSQGLSVLLLTDAVDEFIFAQLSSLKGKTWQSIAKGELPELKEKSEEKTETSQEAEQAESLKTRLGELLKEKVKEVRISKHLVQAPARIVLEQYEVAPHLQGLLKQSGQAVAASKPILEVNMQHIWLKKLATAEANQQDDWAELVFGYAWLADGGQLSDGAAFVKALQNVLSDLELGRLSKI